MSCQGVKSTEGLRGMTEHSPILNTLLYHGGTHMSGEEANVEVEKMFTRFDLMENE